MRLYPDVELDPLALRLAKSLPFCYRDVLLMVQAARRVWPEEDVEKVVLDHARRCLMGNVSALDLSAFIGSKPATTATTTDRSYEPPESRKSSE